MRLIRGLAGALLWLLAAVVGLLGVILCVTVILLPLGIRDKVHVFLRIRSNEAFQPGDSQERQAMPPAHILPRQSDHGRAKTQGFQSRVTPAPVHRIE